MPGSLAQIDESLEELKTHLILVSIDKDVRRGERGRILDVAYRMTPHPYFIAQIKAANKRHNSNLEKLSADSIPFCKS